MLSYVLVAKTSILCLDLIFFQFRHRDGPDYHYQMNSIFCHKVESAFARLYIKQRCSVINNASYHIIREEGTKPPDTGTRKAEMQTWLDKTKKMFDAQSSPIYSYTLLYVSTSQNP